MEEKVPEYGESLADVFVQRGNMLMDALRYNDAHVEFLKAIAADPEDSWAYSRLGVCCSLLGLHEDAVEYGSKAITLSPEWADTHYQLAWIYNHLGEKQKAEQAARDALTCEPHFPEAFAILSWTFLDRDRLDEALVAAEQAMALDPQNVDAFNVQGIANLQLGKLDEAEYALTQVLSIDPENPTAHANLGYVHMHRGKWDTAEDHFRNALRRDPHFEYARLGAKEIVRARNPASRWAANYRLLLDRQPSGFVWVVIFILFKIGYAAVYLFQLEMQTLTWFLGMAPLLLAFAVTLVVVEPVAQVLALMTSAGRMLASPWEKVGGVLLTLLLVFWGVSCVVGLTMKLDLWQGITVLTGYAYLTFAQTWRSDDEWVRYGMVFVSLCVVRMLVSIAVLASGEQNLFTTEKIVALSFGVAVVGLLSLILPRYLYNALYSTEA